MAIHLAATHNNNQIRMQHEGYIWRSDKAKRRAKRVSSDDETMSRYVIRAHHTLSGPSSVLSRPAQAVPYRREGVWRQQAGVRAWAIE